MAETAVTHIEVESLRKLAEGKVRNLYEVDEKSLLFVASDRISAYDVVMENGVSCKGKILTLLSAHWFDVLPTLVPNLQTHFISLSLPSLVPKSEHRLLMHRSMQVRRLKVFPLEAIVRGYITGSAWEEYKSSGTVHTIPMMEGLQESQAFPQGAIYTPSTKADAGKHDENISPAQAAEIVGAKYAQIIEDLAVKLYNSARDYALERGIIIADTKFEFGLDEETDEVVLIDEVLTPDSSRFWPADEYVVGRQQNSFDKQYLRNWLSHEGLKGKEGVTMPQVVIDQTTHKYKTIFERLTGKNLNNIIDS